MPHISVPYVQYKYISCITYFYRNRSKGKNGLKRFGSGAIKLRYSKFCRTLVCRLQTFDMYCAYLTLSAIYTKESSSARFRLGHHKLGVVPEGSDAGDRDALLKHLKGKNVF